MTVYVVGYRDKVPDEAIVIETTSRAITWSKGLSPFSLGPVELSPGLHAKNMENAWQFSKVYKQHIDENGLIKVKEYLDWAMQGWNDTYAHRYPMGKGAKPEFSIKLLPFGKCFIDGSGYKIDEYLPVKKLSYIEARKELYIPFYSKAVSDSDAYNKLADLFFTERQDIYLRDFDGYNHKTLGMTYEDVINCETKKMGHAFVLAMMLEGYLK